MRDWKTLIAQRLAEDTSADAATEIEISYGAARVDPLVALRDE